MQDLAFVSYFGDHRKGRRALALSSALQEYFDVVRYGFGGDAASLDRFTGDESAVLYYLYDDLLLQRVYGLSERIPGCLFIDDIDLYRVLHGVPAGVEEVMRFRDVSSEDVHDAVSGISGFHAVEFDADGERYRWTRRRFTIPTSKEVVELDVYSDVPAVLDCDGERRRIGFRERRTVRFRTGESPVFTVEKPQLQYPLLGEFRELGVRVYNLDSFDVFTREEPRSLAPRFPVLPSHGQVVTPYRAVAGEVGGELVRFGDGDVSGRADEHLVLSHKSTRDELDALLDCLAPDDLVLLRSAYCNVERVVAHHSLETRVAVVSEYDAVPASVVYPYRDDRGVPLLGLYRDSPAVFLDSDYCRSIGTTFALGDTNVMEHAAPFSIDVCDAAETAVRVCEVLG